MYVEAFCTFDFNKASWLNYAVWIYWFLAHRQEFLWVGVNIKDQDWLTTQNVLPIINTKERNLGQQISSLFLSEYLDSLPNWTVDKKKHHPDWYTWTWSSYILLDRVADEGKNWIDRLHLFKFYGCCEEYQILHSVIFSLSILVRTRVHALHYRRCPDVEVMNITWETIKIFPWFCTVLKIEVLHLSSYSCSYKNGSS